MLKQVENLTRRQKRMAFLALDTALIPVTFYMAMALRYGTLLPITLAPTSWILFTLLTVLGCALIYVFRLQNIKLHTFESRAMSQIGLVAVALVVLAVVCRYMLQLAAPRSVPLVFGALLGVLYQERFKTANIQNP